MSTQQDLKAAVKGFWEDEACGTRYMDGPDGFAAHAAQRYALEQMIPTFARFAESTGKRVLEIGVGLGADFAEWVKAGAEATGVDLTEAAVNATQGRLRVQGLSAEVMQADAENLPFADGTFDIVYSWGVIHHSPDTERALAEIHRVLKPGGVARVMIYHRPSWVAVMLWLRWGLLRGRPFRSLYEVVYEHNESPGTKSYTCAEARRLLGRFSRAVQVRSVLSPGDLLEIKPSSKYQSAVYRLLWKIWPRPLVRAIGDGMGHYLLLEAVK